MSTETHWLEVDKRSGEIYRFFVDGQQIPKYKEEDVVTMVPVSPQDMIDVPSIEGQIYNFQTGQTEDSDISWNKKIVMQLDQTDWMVQRHIDQMHLGVEPSMPPDEYRELLLWRENLRRSHRD